MSEPLKLETITSAERMQALAPEWHALFAASGVSLPFMTFEWIDAWWTHMRQDRRAVRDHLSLRSVRNQAGRLVAVVPMMMTERPATGPARVKFLQFFGADPNITEIRGLLSLPEYEKQVYQTLRDGLAAEAWDWIQWTGVRHDRGGGEVIVPGLSVTDNAVPNLYLALPDSWELFHDGLKRNIRESLRKCYNSLRRDNLTFEMRIARCPEAVEGAVGRFLDLHGARAASDVSSISHLNFFAAESARSLLLDVCQRFALRDEARVFEMVIGGEVVATRIGFQFADTLYLYYSGYKPDWGKYSVMTTTVAEAIKYAIGEGLSTVNLSTGRDVSKTRWGPSEIEYDAGVQIAATSRAQIAYRLYQQVLSLNESKVAGKAVRALARSG